MIHEDHVSLLRTGVPGPGGAWADLGSGAGAFTLALADLLGSTATIYSVDRDRRALQSQEQAMRTRFPEAHVVYQCADFSRPLDLPPLDGVVMTNSLHFQRDKPAVLRLVYGYLRPGGRFILVEYSTDVGNHWVPYPLSYPTWQALAASNGFTETQLLAERPSRFLGGMYSAMSIRPAEHDSAARS